MDTRTTAPGVAPHLEQQHAVGELGALPGAREARGLREEEQLLVEAQPARGRDEGGLEGVSLELRRHVPRHGHRVRLRAHEHESELEPHRVCVGVRVGAGEREQLPQLRLLRRELGVGDARLRKAEGHVVPPCAWDADTPIMQ
eukprot:scaffold16424_cov61-Phaeocystis_antarctica.AAC.5